MKTVVGPETRIAGPLSGKDDLEIHGTVDGPVHGEASVTIAAGARIGGEVRGRDVIVGGELAHAVFASGTVRLLATAVLTGDIEAPRIAIDEGAVFDGQVRMRQKKAVSSGVAARSQPTPAPSPSVPQARAIPELATVTRKPLIRKSS
jgi:cytoskeletal protein CcmA (bactofilin family)